MVKRPKTPEHPDDEPKFLTIVHPYPLHANLELTADGIAMALWLFCITRDHSPLISIWHKPKAYSMVILEVARDFDRFEDLLGLHEWDKMLQDPSAQEKGCCSKIFYCQYNSFREVSKLGWKRVAIEDKWFKGRSVQNLIMAHPYPKSTWCALPYENKTIAPLCRPLPVAHFKPPPLSRAPPVGSKEWLEAKEKGRLPDAAAARKATSAPGGLWGNDPLKRSGPSSKAAQQGKPSMSRAPTAPVLSANAPPRQGPPPGLPPPLGLVAPTAFRASAWNSLPPASVPGNTLSNGSSSSDSPVVSPGKPFNWAEEVEAESTRAKSPYGAFQPPDSSSDDEDERLNLPSASVVDTPKVQENLWADYDEEKETEEAEPTCPTHGIVCSKGVCKDYAKLLKDIERREQQEKRKQEQRGWNSRGRGGKQGKNRASREQMTEKQFWARPDRGRLGGQDSGSSSSTASSGPSSKSVSPAPSAVQSRSQSQTPGNNADVWDVEGDFGSWDGSSTQPTAARPADEWDGEGKFGSWGGSDTRSVASSARVAWNNNDEDDDDAQSVVSTSSRAVSEWHMSEGDPWSDMAKPARGGNNSGTRGQSAGRGAWGNKPVQRGRGAGPGQWRGGAWGAAGPAGRQQGPIANTFVQLSSNDDDWGKVSDAPW